MIANTVRVAVTLVVLMAGMSHSATAKKIIWDFIIDESQVKNGTEPDGSTNSIATGTGHFEYDSNSNILAYTIAWSSLFGQLTKLHVHGPATASSSNPAHLIEIFGPPNIPATLDLNSDTWTASHALESLQQTGTNPATGQPYDPTTPGEIIAIMESGQSYLNVHTNVFGVGEIRGNLGLPVPEPAAAFLLALGGFWLFWRGDRPSLRSS